MGVKETIAKNIKDYRKRAGLSQSQLAKKTKLSVRYLSYLENADPNVTIEVLAKVAKGLGISLSELVSEGTYTEAPPKRAKQGLDWAIDALARARDAIDK